MLLRLQNSIASMTDLVRRQERTANNLANANTVGYKRDRAFAEALNERIDEEQAPRSERRTTQWADLTAGALENTGNPLDLAIQGDGFFVLSDDTTGAQRYTRAGRFTLDAEGTLRDAAGHAVEGADGPLQFPSQGGTIEVSDDGEIRMGTQVVGRLRIVRFDDPGQLRRLDGAAFEAGTATPEEVVDPSIRQGVIETSNIDPLREMTEMITHLRLFESQQKVLQTTDQVLGAITRDLGRF